jgi:cation-transporting ATPase 13A1
MYYVKYDVYLGSEEWTFVTLGSIVVLHGLTFLAGQWSISIKALFTCLKVKCYEDGVMEERTLMGICIL